MYGHVLSRFYCKLFSHDNESFSSKPWRPRACRLRRLVFLMSGLLPWPRWPKTPEKVRAKDSSTIFIETLTTVCVCRLLRLVFPMSSLYSRHKNGLKKYVSQRKIHPFRSTLLFVFSVWKYLWSWWCNHCLCCYDALVWRKNNFVMTCRKYDFS